MKNGWTIIHECGGDNEGRKWVFIVSHRDNPFKKDLEVFNLIDKSSGFGPVRLTDDSLNNTDWRIINAWVRPEQVGGWSQRASKAVDKYADWVLKASFSDTIQYIS